MSEEWDCENCGLMTRWPGSGKWPAPSGHVVAWCCHCGGNRKFTRRES